MPIRRPSNDVVLGPWTGGVQNARDQLEVPLQALREGVNVDLLSSGRVRRRRGYLRIAEGRARSLFAAHGSMFVVVDDELRMYESRTSYDVLRAGMPALPVIYAEGVLGTFWTNGAEIGLIEPNGIMRPVWCEAPGQATVSAVAGAGGLAEGLYQVALTWVDGMLRESGSTVAAVVQVPAGGGISVSIPPNPGADYVRAYITEPNGEELQFHSEYAASTTAVLLQKRRLGKPLRTQFLEPMPAGQAIAEMDSRLLVGVGRYLFASEAFAQGLYNPSTYVPLPAEIDMIAPVQRAGVFVGAGKRVYWLSGTSPDKWQLRAAHGAGAVRGSLCYVPERILGNSSSNDSRPYWLGSDGRFCYGRADGSVEIVQRYHVANEGAESGASMVIEKPGLNQIITSLFGGGSSRGRTADIASIEVRKNGIVNL